MLVRRETYQLLIAGEVYFEGTWPECRVFLSRITTANEDRFDCVKVTNPTHQPTAV
jgi:hypothetical protein